ncbi:MAG: type II toxin-antitoxin system RelE/ParE family toxin [Candidatus Heimdallarchaeota archaeon]|nr:type II toxin-antitoxin system RelE/ParE family toxin [Candidatus Heimdallarchaeota archaeon]
MYEILFSRKAAKAIRSLPKIYQKRLKEILSSLKINPYSYPYKKIQGEVGLYRIRLGKFRILYEVRSSSEEIYFLKIELRKKAYK